MAGSRIGRLIALACLAALAQGCGTLPDASKFADATAQMHTAVVSSGAAVAASLDEAAEKERGTQLRQAWKSTSTVTSAMASYSGAVADVLKAGTEGAETVRRVTAAGQTLASTLGIAFAGVKPAVDLLAAIGQHVAQAAAARSAEEVLARMQPVADNTGELLSRQLDDLEAVLRSAGALSVQRIRDTVSKERSYAGLLGDERRKLYSRPPDDAIAARLRQIDEVERTVQAKIDAADRKVADAEARTRTGRQLIGAARQTAGEWPVAHRQLLDAVRESRSIDPRALAAAVTEIRDLVKKVRDQ